MGTGIIIVTNPLGKTQSEVVSGYSETSLYGLFTKRQCNNMCIKDRSEVSKIFIKH